MTRSTTKPRPFPVIDLVRAAAPRGEPQTWPPRHALEDSLPIVAVAPTPPAAALYVPRDSKNISRSPARQDMT
ncbi:hypothetical protein [Nannocystis pusilla]|uniref:hypothetical protein n=1 Tax=Nannocystis pusilla TaxID=889268 RepID=UPI003BF0E94B